MTFPAPLQTRLLRECCMTGSTPLFTGEVRAARRLVARRLGAFSVHRSHRFFTINRRGRALLRAMHRFVDAWNKDAQ